MTPSLTWKPRFKTKKEFHQNNKDWSSLESNLKTEELFLTTTFKKSRPCTLCSVSEVVPCKSSSRLWLVKLSLLMSNQMTRSPTSKLRSKTRKGSLQSNKDSSSLVNSWKMDVLFLTTTSKRSLLCTLYFVLEVVPCKSSSRPWLVRPSP